jgi:hypothetical protein
MNAGLLCFRPRQKHLFYDTSCQPFLVQESYIEIVIRSIGAFARRLWSWNSKFFYWSFSNKVLDFFHKKNKKKTLGQNVAALSKGWIKYSQHTSLFYFFHSQS